MIVCKVEEKGELGEERGVYVHGCTLGSELTSSLLFKQPSPGLLFILLDEYTAKHQDTCKIECRGDEHSPRVLRA